MVTSMCLSVSGGTVGGPTLRRPSDLGNYFQPSSGNADKPAAAFAFAREVNEPEPTPNGRRAIRRVIGGYDVDQVDRLLTLAERAVADGGEVQRAFARQELRMTELNRRVVGY